MGNVNDYITYSNDFMAWSKAVGMASGSLNGVASDVGIHAGPMFSLYMNGGELPDVSLIGDTFTSNNGSNGTTTTTTDPITGKKITTTTTTVTTTSETTNNTSTSNGTDLISSSYEAQCAKASAEIKEMLETAKAHIEASKESLGTTSEITDEYGNKLAVDENGNKYDPEKIKAVQDILDSEAKQIEFERLAKQMDSAIEGSNSEKETKPWFGSWDFWNWGSDTDKEKQWKEDSAAMQKALGNMSKEEYAAFSQYYSARSEAQTGTATTPSMALAAAENNDRGIIKSSTVDKIAAKADESNKWLKELPTGETETTKAEKAAERAEADKVVQEEIKKLENKMEDILTDAATARALGNEDLAITLEGEAKKMENDIVDLQS